MVDGTVLGTTIVSLMVNGLCCAYQQKEEKEHREAIRRDLRAEYWHQRLMDLEIEHRRGGPSEERDSPSNNSSVTSLLAEERRRKLQHDKQRAAQAPPGMVVITPASSVSSSPQSTPTRPSSRGAIMKPNRMVKTTSLMDESDDDESDSENEARYRSNSLFDEDDSQEVKHVDDDGFVEVSLV